MFFNGSIEACCGSRHKDFYRSVTGRNVYVYVLFCFVSTFPLHNVLMSGSVTKCMFFVWLVMITEPMVFYETMDTVLMLF